MGKGPLIWPGGPPREAVEIRVSPRTAFFAFLALLSLVTLAGEAAAHAAGSAHPDAWNRLVIIVLVMAFGVGAFVFALMALALWRYREGSPYVRREPKTHDVRLERIWTAIPVILVAVIVVLSIQVMVQSDDAPEDSIRIKVIGRQYEWAFVYPDNTSSLNEVWVEEGQNVVFEITALDVVHSFFLPEFYLKVDAFPRYVEETSIVAEPPGTYDIWCAEYCGEEHTEMVAQLHVYPRGLHDQPYGPPPGEVPPPPPVERVNVTLEMREDGGAGPDRPWSIQPSTVEIPLDGEVTMVVWNNGTRSFDLVLGPPYGRKVLEIPPGEFRYLNFTADKPTAGTYCYCDVGDYREKGLEATVRVVGEASGEPLSLTGDEDGRDWLPAVVLVSVVASALTLWLAVRRPKGDGAGKGEAGQGDPAGDADEGPREGDGA